MTQVTGKLVPPLLGGRLCLHTLLPAAVVLLVFTVSCAVRLDGLDLYTTTDEGYWIQRTIRFGAALARGDLASTFRAGHPGVTIMWTGLLGIGPERLAPFLPERFTRFELLERAPGYLEAFSAARHAVAILAAGLVTLAVMLAWRLLGTGPALVGGAILTLDPYVVGMTRLLHVDALLAPLMTVSALAGLLYWTQAPRWPYLLLSAVAGGLALLTKAPAGFLALFFGLVCLVGLVRRRGRQGWRAAGGLLLWGLCASAVYVLLFPALWVDPIGRAQLLIEFVTVVGLQPHNGNFFLGRPVLADPGPWYYAVALPLRLSPLVALGMGLYALPACPEERTTAVRWLLVYAILFVVLMTFASKKFDRYMLPAQMALDLLAGVGLWRLAGLAAGWRRRKAPSPVTRDADCERAMARGDRLLDRVRSPLPIPSPVRGRGAILGRLPLSRVRGRGEPAVLLALVLAVQLGLLTAVRPYPIAYYNPLAGGPERASQLIMVGWGEGLEQAASFLNGLPDAETLYVVTSYHHVVRPRFVGTTIAMTPYLRPPPGQPLPAPDYVVLYLNARQRRQISPEVGRAEALGQPVFVARVNGVPYAWVYQVPRTGPRPAGPPPTPDDAESEEN